MCKRSVCVGIVGIVEAGEIYGCNWRGEPHSLGPPCRDKVFCRSDIVPTSKAGFLCVNLQAPAPAWY